MSLLESLTAIFSAAVTGGVTPGGVLGAGEIGGFSVCVPFGTTHQDPRVATAVTTSTIYDIASLTKPVATWATFVRLASSGRVSLDTRAVDLLPELTAAGAEDITVAHLLGHAAGFPDHIDFFKRLRRGDYAGAATAREGLVRMVGQTPLVAPPGHLVRYSDLGYILLGALLERVAGAPLDDLAHRLLFSPLGMSTTFYVDLTATGRTARRATIAPTEVCPYRGLVQGEVHDENAHAAGGVAGHAGLFSTAEDLVLFARAMLTALRGEQGLLPPALVCKLAATPSAKDSTWRLGWDTPSLAPGVSHAGDEWPKDGIGHLAFTGCSMWLAPSTQRYAVLLTNRVHPTRTKGGIRELRRAVMDAVATTEG